MTSFYKIRHIPTGLFYQTTKGRSWEKNNLSENGKVYTRKPSLKHINHGYNIIHKIKEYPYKRSEFKRFDSSEWEIVEYVVVEKELWNNLIEVSEKIPEEFNKTFNKKLKDILA